MVNLLLHGLLVSYHGGAGGVFSALLCLQIPGNYVHELLSLCHNFVFLVADVTHPRFYKTDPFSCYLDLISVYGGGGSSGTPVDVPCVLRICVAGAVVEEWSVSRLNNDMDKNSCLFLHSCWLAANPSLSAGFGGGSVILVMRYAVDASAIP